MRYLTLQIIQFTRGCDQSAIDDLQQNSTKLKDIFLLRVLPSAFGIELDYCIVLAKIKSKQGCYLFVTFNPLSAFCKI